MEYNIRRREKKDCKDIAHVVTVSWNETYKGIISDEILCKTNTSISFICDENFDYKKLNLKK